ncbi:MAG: hypothetical protein JWO56_2328, partial [Acidobacteria bacterium]|nr:hypothetical protein [Acidobacteriota bacterium]
VTKIALLLLLATSTFTSTFTSAFANELTVDRRTVQLDETVSISITLEGPFAGVDGVRLPLQNLELAGQPSVSSEFSWTNGVVARRKILRYTARPKAPGAALVGPLVLLAADGRQETLAPVSIQVLPDTATSSNDPLTIFRELVATHRDPIFVVAEVDKTSALAGEEVVVTWTVYNAATVQQWQLVDLPKLEDFWSEELDVRGEQQEQVLLDDQIVQKVAVRRVALFPLRSGTLRIAPLGIEALVLRRTSGPFGFFEGSTVDVTRRSGAVAIDVRPLPDGAAADAVGDVTLSCTKPLQRNGGPVALSVTLRGRANLRAAVPPHWERPLDGSFSIGERPVTVERARASASMTRTWSYLVFPAHAGRFTLPPLVSNIVTPNAARETLRCEAVTLDVTAAAPPLTEPPPATPTAARVRSLRPYLPWAGGALLLLVLGGMSIPRLRRAAELRRRVRMLTRGKTPAEVREAVEAMLAERGLQPAALLVESSGRGDAFRALRSLIDAADRLDVTPRELEDRVRDLVQSFG